MTDRPLRAMWLLNHTTARQFEIPMLKRAGISEVFLPKRIPVDASFRSGSVDYSEDAGLTIPPADLALLNDADWYSGATAEAWQVANKHFDLAFLILLSLRPLHLAVRHFSGAKIWRAYGLERSMTYGKQLERLSSGGLGWPTGSSNIWFGQAYPHLADAEPLYLQDRAIFLPAGLIDAKLQDRWSGTRASVLLICPDVGFNPYCQEIYADFRRRFGDLPYAVGGSQPIAVEDPHVLGHLPTDEYQRNMREFRVMFYPSTEPRHLHYHPIEAVRAGMPLVFMAGGILDRLGGSKLSGRCRSIDEARAKLQAILSNDRRLIDAIRSDQAILLEQMSAEWTEPHWRKGIQQVLAGLRERPAPAKATRRKRVAVLLPAPYRGGTLRSAVLLANAIAQGSAESTEAVDVVFGHLDVTDLYEAADFAELVPSIKRRPFNWKTLTAADAQRVAEYAGVRTRLRPQTYQVPNDGISHFLDCDLWLVVSDRMLLPLLPLRPSALLVFDYLQRYVPDMGEHNSAFISRAHEAEMVLVTTEFTRLDAMQFAGLPPAKVRKMPFLVPTMTGGSPQELGQRYFIWTTNLARHKNHANAVRALQIYYDELGGALECHVTGVGTDRLLTTKGERHLAILERLLSESPRLAEKLKLEGDLPEVAYRRLLASAAFLWHPARIDNGTLSVVEAAQFQVPALSSDYPPMRELDVHFNLGLHWMDADDPHDMARGLMQMELNLDVARARLPRPGLVAARATEKVASSYWSAIKELI